jgi:hypothetical protein
MDWRVLTALIVICGLSIGVLAGWLLFLAPIEVHPLVRLISLGMMISYLNAYLDEE